jgi:hypothetical protein
MGNSVSIPPSMNPASSTRSQSQQERAASMANDRVDNRIKPAFDTAGEGIKNGNITAEEQTKLQPAANDLIEATRQYRNTSNNGGVNKEAELRAAEENVKNKTTAFENQVNQANNGTL